MRMGITFPLGIAALAVGLFVYKERRGIRRLPQTPPTDHFVVVVTGANRGIGKEICAALLSAQTSRATIFLCSRSLTQGEKVASELQKRVIETRPSSLRDSIKVTALSLDIESQSSVDDAVKQLLAASVGHVDVLINNAGFAYKMADTTPFPKQAERTMEINYEGTKRVTEAFLPLLRKSTLGGRVVSVSSMTGRLKRGDHKKESIYARFTKSDSVADIDLLVQEFVAAASHGSHRAEGFSGSAYSVSKSAVTHYSRVQTAKFKDVMFAAVCPGFCRTDMAGGEWKSVMSVVFWAVSWILGQSARAGADTPCYMAMCSAQEFEERAGVLIQDRKVLGF